MPRKQDVVAQAKRMLGSYEAAAEQLRSVHSDLVPREEVLESMDSAERVAVAVPRETPLGGGPPAGASGAGASVESAVAAERTETLARGLDAMKKVERGEDIGPAEQAGLEAIILLAGRPALLVQNGDFLEPPKRWAHLKDTRAQIRDVISRVGRIEVANNPNFEWLGTGFLAGADIVITNRHVAMEFARSDGPLWSFRGSMTASVDFNEELGAEDPAEFRVTEIVGIHDVHDMAVLRVEQVAGPLQLPAPLSVSKDAPKTLLGREVYVVGYPAWDGRRNDPEPMLRIFSNIFNVKRLQPGEVAGDTVAGGEIFHDCSTLGGNSGSPVFDLETHKVIGLHFGGRFLQKNHAVPLWTLQADPLVQRAGLNFQ